MTTWRYQTFLWMSVKNISRVSATNEWNIFKQYKIIFVSLSGQVMFYLLYINTNEIAKPFNFRCERYMYNLLCYRSNVIFICQLKITRHFHLQLWRYHFFASRSPNISLVFICSFSRNYKLCWERCIQNDNNYNCF